MIEINLPYKFNSKNMSVTPYLEQTKKESLMSKKDSKNFPHSQSDLNTSNLVLEYSKNKKLTETQLMDIRTRFNTWEKDGREVDF